MLDILISKEEQVQALAEAFGVRPQVFRRMDADVVERAYRYMLYRWA